MEPERIKLLNDRPPDGAGRYVLYWMQAGAASGLQPCARACDRTGGRARAARGGRFRADGRLPGSQPAPLPVHAGGPAGDGGGPGAARHPLRPAPGRAGRGGARAGAEALGRGLRQGLSAPPAGLAASMWPTRAGRQVVEVEGEVVVPVELASDKAEIGARTLRPRILRLREEFLQPLPERTPRVGALTPGLRADLDPSDVDGILRHPQARPLGGARRAAFGVAPARRAGSTGPFLGTELTGYRDGRSEPAHRRTTELSPYLHFGQISPVEVALAGDRGSAGWRRRPRLVPRGADRPPRAGAQLRLAIDPDYDSFDCLPRWARATLDKHRRGSARAPLRRATSWRPGRTHDPYFNAAMREMRLTGLHAQLHAHVLGQEDPGMVAKPRGRPTRRRCGSTTATSCAAAARTPSPTSPGSSASTTGPGSSARYSARSAT